MTTTLAIIAVVVSISALLVALWQGNSNRRSRSIKAGEAHRSGLSRK